MTFKTFRTEPKTIIFKEKDPKDETSKVQVATNIQLLRKGSFSYWDPGDMDINEGHLLSMVNNFDKNVRGIDLAIDYSHNMFSEAAGWIKKLYLSDDQNELWAEVEWTPKAAKCLEDKEYRYLSSEFSFSYKDNESSTDYGPTLFGAGLTNRPFVKNMDPVIPLAEVKNKESHMTLEELKKQVDEKDAEIKRLSDMNAERASSLEEKEKKIKEIEKRQAEEKVLSEKQATFDKMLSEAKVVEAQREAFLAGDMVRFSELAGSIKLDSLGHDQKITTPTSENLLTPEQAEEKVLTLAKDRMGKNPQLKFRDAVVQVLSENKSIAAKYQSKFD